MLREQRVYVRVREKEVNICKTLRTGRTKKHRVVKKVRKKKTEASVRVRAEGEREGQGRGPSHTRDKKEKKTRASEEGRER